MNICIFGAGIKGKHLLGMLKGVFNSPEVNFIFLDNDAQKHTNNYFDNAPCFSPKDFLSPNNSNTLVFCTIPECLEDLRNMGYNNVRLVANARYLLPEKCRESDYVKARPFNSYDSPYQDLTYLYANEQKIWGGVQK